MTLARKSLAAIGMALAVGAASAAFAHHSAVMYDHAHVTTLDGVVKSFNWTNPHSTLEFMANAKPGETATLWTVEASSPGVLTRNGWTKRSFNPGDHVQIQLNPLKDGAPGGQFVKGMNLATGQTMMWSFAGAGEKPLQ
jgi:hypothetical protein